MWKKKYIIRKDDIEEFWVDGCCRFSSKASQAKTFDSEEEAVAEFPRIMERSLCEINNLIIMTLWKKK